MNASQIQDLLDSLTDYMQECEDTGATPNLQVITQPSQPMEAAISGFTITDDGNFILGIAGPHAQANYADLENLDGF